MTFAVVATLYVAGAELAWRMFGAADIGLAFFPPAGVTFAALVVSPRSRWYAVISAVVLAEVAVDMQHDLSSSVAFGYAFANSIEPVVGALLFSEACKRWRIAPTLSRRSGMFVFLACGTVAGPVFGGIVGGAVRALHSNAGWFEAGYHWAAGDGIAVLVVGGPILCLRDAAWPESAKRYVEAFGGLVVSVTISLLSFWFWTVPPSFLILPVLAWAATRFGVPGLAVTGFIVAFSANVSTAAGRGPFAALEMSSQGQLSLLQLFVAANILIGWFLALETNERAAAIEGRTSAIEAQRRAELAASLGGLSVTLAQVSSPVEVCRLVSDYVSESFDANLVAVEFRDDTQDHAATTESQEHPGPHAMRLGEPLWFSSRDDLVSRYPSAQFASGEWPEALAALPLAGGPQPVGFLLVGRDRAAPFDPAERAGLAAVASIASQAIDRSKLFTAEIQARLHAEILREHANRAAAAVLPRDVAVVTGRSIHDALGSTGYAVAIRERNSLVVHFVHGGDNPVEQKWHRSPLERDTPLHETVRSGKAAEIHGFVGRSGRYTADVVAALQYFESVYFWPLPNCAGAIAIGFAEERHLTGAETDLLEAIGSQHGESLQRAVLHENVQRRSLNSEALQELATVLAAATSPPEMAEIIVSHAHRTTGAQYSQIGLVDRERSVIELYHGDSLVEAVRQDWPSAPLDSPIPIATAIRERRNVIVNSREQLAREYPAVVDAAERSGYMSVVTVPIVSGNDGTVMGTLSVAWEKPHSVDSGIVEVVEDICRRLAGALDRAAHAQRLSRLAEREHATATLLQRALLPARLVSHPRASFAAQYVPSDETLLVGGDWYETVTLPDGRIAVAVGDIVGHGLEAAAMMGQMRTAFAALAAGSDTPTALLEQLDGFARSTQSLSTIAIAFLDPGLGSVSYVCAGHPPILCIPKGGASYFLDDGRSWPIGVHHTDPRPEAGHVRLSTGDKLLVYSDGLIERRGEVIDLGFNRLRSVADRFGSASPVDFCNLVISEFVDCRPPGDDVVALVVELLPPNADSSS